jgi:hypothetical protein
VERHYCWATKPLELGFYIYICNHHLYAIQSKSFPFQFGTKAIFFFSLSTPIHGSRWASPGRLLRHLVSSSWPPPGCHPLPLPRPHLPHDAGKPDAPPCSACLSFPSSTPAFFSLGRRHRKARCRNCLFSLGSLPPSPFPFIAFVGSVTAAVFPLGFTVVVTFPARSIVPLAGSPSSQLDPSLSWPSQSDLPLPLLFYRDHHDRRRRVCCRWAPWRGSSMSGRSKKQEVWPACALLLCRPTDRWRSNVDPSPLKNRLFLRVSRPRPPQLRLPRHPGAIVFLESTLVSTPAATFTPTWRVTAGDINPSSPTFGFYSNLIVCGAPVVTMCVGRRHCWAAVPLGLGFCVYM